MKSIVLGAGQVGATIAERLAIEANDVVVVDTQAAPLRALRNRLDIGTVLGNGAHPRILEEAGAADADFLIAVTNSDAVNMLACQVAFTLFQTPAKLARIRSHEFLLHEQLFVRDAIAVDVRISPEQRLTRHIEQLILHPGALQVLDFADGQLQLVAVRAEHEGVLVGQAIRHLHAHLPQVQWRVAAIYRRGEPMMPTGDTIIKVHDEVFFLASSGDIEKIMHTLRHSDDANRRIIIAGGGNIGRRMAEVMESRYQVKLIEQNPTRAGFLAEKLHNTLVISGDATDKELLLEESIDSTDVFCALTENDESNVIASIVAKRLGADQVMAIINRPAYADLMVGGEIDIAISPQQVTASCLLQHVRRADMTQVYSLRHGTAEAIEAVVHGNRETSQVVGRSIEMLALPRGVTVGAVVRDGKVLMAHHDTVIESEDRVILFVFDQRRSREVERLFQVGFAFI